jgi:4-aminobutyrate aminotransferase-like enzyme
VARAVVTGRHLLRRLGGLADLPAVGEVRGLGHMAAVEIVADRGTRAPYPPAARMGQRIQAEALARGVIVYASGGQASGAGDLLLLGPPLTISTTEVDMAVDVLGDAIAAATRG